MRQWIVTILLMALMQAHGQTTSRFSPDRLTVAAAAGFNVHPGDAPLLRGGPPPNDVCTGVVIQALSPGGSVEIHGDNTGSTDTEGWGNPNAWEAFDLTDCASVTVSYCGTAPLFEVVYSILIMGCPPMGDVQRTDTSSCADGNVQILYADLLPGIYYIPVLAVPGLCEGPYTITCTAVPCDVPPANDFCANADTLAVHMTCTPDSATVGGNALAMPTAIGPACAAPGTQFQDVWFVFNSGDNSAVTITLDPITIADMGVEVRDTCGGNVIYCAPSDTSHTLIVDPFTDYRVKVFTNNSLGTGGSFTICISGEVSTGIVPVDEAEWVVAPNPTSGTLTLWHPDLLDDAHVEVFDPLGRRLMDQWMDRGIQGPLTLDLGSAGTTGLIFLRITTTNDQIVRPVTLY